MAAPPFRKLLIANRGAIARRIIRTCKSMGIATVAVYSEADAASLHVADADEAVCIGPPPAAESYLRGDAIVEIAKRLSVEAIHPGYGFLSENVAFAEACAAANIAFVGPTPDNIRAFGLKHTARALAQAQNVPLAPGTGVLASAEEAVEAARGIGFPVIVKATAGGGGIGMRVCEDEAAVLAAFDAVARLGAGNFADARVFLERYVRRARHIEVQVFGDGAGRVIALGERDCSLQRRNQKVIEETPAPRLPPPTRFALMDSAVRLCAAAKYLSAGTVEFLYDSERDDFFFLEVNTRLQVEHGVTEQVTGTDLVEWMIRGAAGDFSMLEGWKGEARGASIQARLYGEDPAQDFRPSSGVLSEVRFPGDARVETWVENGAEVSAFYDPMIAKLIVTASDRPAAVNALQKALDETHLAGIETNLDWLRHVARSEAFTTGNVSTRALDEIAYRPVGALVISGGPATSVQDYPGRLGYWDVGVPPSGPMDGLSFSLANRILGNREDAAGVEFTGVGPSLLFQHDCTICLTGAEFSATLDGVPVPPYEPVAVRSGQTLKTGRVKGAGLRGYLAVRGGVAAPVYLGSRATFTLGGFGGPSGRAIAAGDVIMFAQPNAKASPESRLTAQARPAITRDWVLRVLYGPHGAPDFFAPEDIAMIGATSWRVHHNSSRTGVRLIGPKPRWARADGGEAGLHPSNIHDNAYAVGAVDFTGDMPIILGPDGPSLGGFVCPFVLIVADLWKLGQLAPGDAVRFEPVSEEDAAIAAQAERTLIETLAPPNLPDETTPPPASPILHDAPACGARPRALYRRQGDDNVLIEYGPLTLDIELRLRVQALLEALRAACLPGVIDLTPGVRSLQVHYDPSALSQRALLDRLIALDDSLGDLSDFEIPSRIVHLPLSWKDPAVYQTIEKYIASVRDDAPWCPDNIEFIRRINGLASIDDVHRIVFDANYLVLGLGDVYLGAPVATPIDPRHRLVTTKYNPARTWTPPNVVGIGGAYICIYGMEGPGGYQLFGRTIQVWNTYRQTRDFIEGKPWLLRFFDQIKFFPVSAEELVEWRREFPAGRRSLNIEHRTFRLRDYRAFLAANAQEIDAFQKARQRAFDAEREAWRANGEFERVEALAEEEAPDDAAAAELPAGCEMIEAPLGGSVWRIDAKAGDRVAADSIVAIVEAMKTECAVHAPVGGIIRAVYAREKQMIAPGAPMFAIEPA
jgi:urea carboxylase